MIPNIRAVILAAGPPRRPGPLVPAADRPLLPRVAAEVCAAPVDGVAVVLGAAADERARSLAGLPVVLLRNPDWAEGAASSIRVATAWAERTRASGLLLCLCDHGWLGAPHVTRLIAAHHASCRGLVASAYRGALGAPALFPRRLFPQLGALSGDGGARDVIRSHHDAVAIDVPASACAIDAPAERAASAHGG
ncbi:MAG TPA: nucleotidyltransferase family protein [Kofleriaceae bacterium]|nr:nucleotidyltransferase family protein [Kofleriaceae bacterium]